MILTKDNILRFVREKKAVTPTMVSEAFDTTTTIASAALSEIAKEKSIAITHLKLASSPYYYDPRQKECLIELGEKHLGRAEKEMLFSLKENKILSDNSLTIQERLAIEKIKDFAIPIEVSVSGKSYKFWVWYLRDIDATKKQIVDALKESSTGGSASNSTKSSSQNETRNKQASKPKNNDNKEYSQRNEQVHVSQSSTQNVNNRNLRSFTQSSSGQSINLRVEEDQKEQFIENFLKDNYLQIESKNKQDKGILYCVSLKLNRITIFMDCFYFYKKTTDAELFKFHTSSLKPKIVFIENCPKKLITLSENIENLIIVNI